MTDSTDQTEWPDEEGSRVRKKHNLSDLTVKLGKGSTLKGPS